MNEHKKKNLQFQLNFAENKMRGIFNGADIESLYFQELENEIETLKRELGENWERRRRE